jgi:hypothetical protein
VRPAACCRRVLIIPRLPGATPGASAGAGATGAGAAGASACVGSGWGRGVLSGGDRSRGGDSGGHCRPVRCTLQADCSSHCRPNSQTICHPNSQTVCVSHGAAHRAAIWPALGRALGAAQRTAVGGADFPLRSAVWPAD